MSKSKYDTNPLDQDVKRAADERMRAGSRDSADLEDNPTAVMPDSAARLAESAERNESRLPRPTEPPSHRSGTQPGKAMTSADLSSPPTGPAYIPPSRSGAARPQPGYQAPPPANQASGRYQTAYQNYPPPYPPPAGPQAQVPYRPAPPPNRGLNLDTNIEGALCYIPGLGWIMGIIVLAKEPKTNVFARFHALQSLILHGGLLLLKITLGILQGLAFAVARPLGQLFNGLESLVDLAAFVGLVILAITAFQMKIIKVPGVSELAEKHTLPEPPTGPLRR